MEAINLFVELVNAFLHVYIGYVFFSSFGNLRRSRTFVVGYLILCIFVLTVSLVLFKGKMFFYFPLILVSFAIAVLFDNKFLNKILSTVLLFAIGCIVETFIGFLVMLIFNIEIQSITSYSSYHILGMLLSKFVLFLIVLFIRIKKHSILLKQYKKKYLSVFLFPAATLAIAILQYKVFIEYPEQDMVTKYGVLVSYTTLVFANIIVFDFIDSLYKNAVNQSKLQAADEIIISQTEQYQTIIDHNTKILKIRHDHKNFCVGLRYELENGNVDKAIEILDQEYSIIPNEGITLTSAALAIINIKQQLATEKGIEFICDYVDINRIKILPTDLAIILGNALDNAIEACELLSADEYRYIEINISIKNNVIYIIIKNPVCKDVDINNTLTTKNEDCSLHGFGIISMKQIANKYDGEILISCKDRVFTIIAVLKNNF